MAGAFGRPLALAAARGLLIFDAQAHPSAVSHAVEVVDVPTCLVEVADVPTCLVEVADVQAESPAPVEDEPAPVAGPSAASLVSDVSPPRRRPADDVSPHKHEDTPTATEVESPVPGTAASSLEQLTDHAVDPAGPSSSEGGFSDESVFDDWDLSGSEKLQLAQLSVLKAADKPESHSHEQAGEGTGDITQTPVGRPAPRGADDRHSVPEPEDHVPSRVTLTPDVQAAAARACSTPQPAEVSELIWRLLFDGCDGLAWQVDRRAEAAFSGTIGPGTELLSLWLLGRSLSRPDGGLATELTQTLLNVSTAISAEEEDSDSAARRALLLAAVLRPCVRAPWTGAYRTVGAIAEQFDDPRLAQYFRNVARLGELGYEAALQSARNLDNSTDSVNPLNWLQAAARRWQSTASAQRVRFQRSEPLFSRRHWSVSMFPVQTDRQAAVAIGGWLHALRLSDGIIAPILNHDVAEAGGVRTVVNRIENRLLVGRREDYPAAIDAIILPDVAMATHLCEAAELARRWLEFGTTHLGAATTELNQQVVDLQETIRGQHPLVLSRLESMAFQADTLANQTALACLTLAAEQLDADLASGSSAAADEPSLHELFGVEAIERDTRSADGHQLDRAESATPLQLLLDELARGVHQTRIGVDDSAPASTASVSVFDDDDDDSPADASTSARLMSAAAIKHELDVMSEVLNSAVASGTMSPHDREAFRVRILAVQRQRGDAEQKSTLGELRKTLTARGLLAGLGQAQGVSSSPDKSSSVVADD
ncbi:MAG: hypothetical protein KDA75_10735 [Planctomycetaceae bacterium]|nr:hypothetical protein [Planctomycetaceae bacterium]